MTAMVSTLLAGPRERLLPVVGCALLTVVALLSGCARAVDGRPRSADPGVSLVKPIPLADLLIEPTRFPARYPAVVLDPKDVGRVLQDIDGVPVGSVVTPPECAPPPIAAQQSAAARGIDEDSGASLIVTVTRPATSLRARVDQLAECSSFTGAVGGEAARAAEVAVELPPAPPVDADDSYAVDQTVTFQTPESEDSRTLTLVALVGDVQVTASWQRRDTSENPADSHELDALFTDAVLKVRGLVPR
jgi:hypothetical protein